MKKIYSFGACLLFAASLSAQAPSLDFESAWVVTTGGAANPVGWTSTNVLVALGDDTTVIQAAAPNVHGGSKAMKIETIHLATNPVSSSGIPDTSCFALTGKVILSPASIKSGYPYAIRTNQLSFFYKYTPVGGDSGTVGMYLTKWTGSSRDTVASGMMHLGAQASYSASTLTLTYKPAYFSSGNPDTAMIFFASSNIKSVIVTSGHMNIVFNGPKIGSLLWVDDIAMSYVGIKEIKSAENISYYPNPSTDVLNFNFENVSERTILLFDMAGKLVGETAVKEKAVSIKTSELQNGMYYFKIKNSKNEVVGTEKFLIAR
jgi:hypothetical protein